MFENIFPNTSYTGVKRKSNDWKTYVFTPARETILKGLSNYGEANDFGFWLNDLLHEHSEIRQRHLNDLLSNKSEFDPRVFLYQNAFSGLTDELFNTKLGNDKLINWNNYGIANSYNKGIFQTPGIRISKDNPKNKYFSDGLYSGITDWRYLLGRKGDWDETSDLFKTWQADLNKLGWETYLDTSDDYYKLRRIPKNNPLITSFLTKSTSLNTPPSATPVVSLQPPQSVPATTGESNSVQANKIEPPLNWWLKFFKQGLPKVGQQILTNLPNLISDVRLINSLNTNKDIYETALKGVRPNLKLTYNTYRQVVGDEATKQAYYNRGAQGITRASQAFTSDADRLMAYLMEALKNANELRAQGDLADNQRIRETSAESSQHADANIARRTDVANYNNEQINAANQAKWNLLAQKKSADYTSWNNFLTERETRLRLKLKEILSLDDLIWLYGLLNLLLNDPDVLAASLELLLAEKNATDERGILDTSDITYRQAYLKYQTALNNALIRILLQKKQRRLSLFGKYGVKITTKKSDNLLYKTARDAVEHFRKMTKLTDDSYLKSRKKNIKLIPHPTKKLLLGGVAPFVVYTPAPNAYETSTAVTSDSSAGGKGSSSSKSDSGKELIDVLKSLFTKLEGLPADVEAVYTPITNLLNKVKAFGGEMSTSDIATAYLQSMRYLNTVKHSLSLYNEARKNVIDNEALSDYAIYGGRLVVLDLNNGKISFVSPNDLDTETQNPLTNDLLLRLRAINPDMAFNDTWLLIVNNGIGMTKIASLIKALAGNVGTTELLQQGYTNKQAGEIAKGLELLQDSPDGIYKFETLTKDLLSQVQAALVYISAMLPKNMKETLSVNAQLMGTSVDKLIMTGLTSLMNLTYSTKFTAVTGKASDKEDSVSGKNDMIPAIAFFEGLGEKSLIIISDKTSDGLRVNTISAPITKEGHNTGQITLDELSRSDYEGQLDISLATMGDSLISPSGRINVLIGDRIHLAELPIDRAAKLKGITKPDLSFLRKIEEADTKLREMGIDKNNPKNILIINKIYKEHNLPIIYVEGSNKPTLTSQYARFAMIDGYATEDAFDESAEFNDGVIEVEGKEREQFISTMKNLNKNGKYDINNDTVILGVNLGGGTDVYKGIIYIPMGNSTISALGGTGYKATGSEYNELEKLLQLSDYARLMGFNSKGGWNK